MLTTEDLYKEHWQYVYDLLPAYGVRGPDQEDVAQEVWCTVQTRLHTYAPAQGTPRAWLTGIVRNCAANHRYYQRREQVCLEEDLREAAVASRATAAELDYGSLRSRGSLDPEQQAMLYWLIRQALADDEQFEAFVLRHFLGNTIEEIAGIQGASESAVEWRIKTAKERLREGDEDQHKAFWGFGMLDALAEAMQSPPRSPERSAELWRRVSAQIGSPGGPAAGLASAPHAGLLASKPVLAGLLGSVLLLGGEVGAGGALACGPAATMHVAPEPEPELPVAPAQGTAPAGQGAVPAAPAPAPSADAVTTAVASSSRPVAPRPALGSSAKAPPTAVLDEHDRRMGSSKRLILQIHAASQAGNCTLALKLIEEHEQTFPDLDVHPRNVERSRCR